MADNETTATPPVATDPAAPAAPSSAGPEAPAVPVEHKASDVDPSPLQDVLNGLASQAGPKAGQPGTETPDEGDTRKPLGDVAGCP